MSPAIIVALTPLWFGLVGAVFVLTFGRRIAQRERQIRLQLEKQEEEQQLLVGSDQLANLRAALMGYVSTAWPVVSGSTGIYYAPSGSLVYTQGRLAFAPGLGSQVTTESTKPEQQTELEKKSRPPLAA